ncbi:hypothetical protein PsAD5_05563 [Pseudovibrio sp. Ad5]|nr:hypothetical protein PsAD5_05563 [Pseudovibrio sp. Ad5]
MLIARSNRASETIPVELIEAACFCAGFLEGKLLQACFVRILNRKMVFSFPGRAKNT